jgi:hypothetical protein
MPIGERHCALRYFSRRMRLGFKVMGPEPEYKVIVLFPGETMPTTLSNPAAQQ